jgi:hypothetical protein
MSEQTKDKHPLTRKYIAKVAGAKKIPLDNEGNFLSVEPDSIISVSAPYEGQTGGRVVLVQPHGSDEGKGMQGSSTFTMLVSDLNKYYKPYDANSSEGFRAARSARREKKYTEIGGPPGRRGAELFAASKNSPESKMEDTEYNLDNLIVELLEYSNDELIEFAESLTDDQFDALCEEMRDNEDPAVRKTRRSLMTARAAMARGARDEFRPMRGQESEAKKAEMRTRGILATGEVGQGIGKDNPGGQTPFEELLTRRNAGQRVRTRQGIDQFYGATLGRKRAGEVLGDDSLALQRGPIDPNDAAKLNRAVNKVMTDRTIARGYTSRGEQHMPVQSTGAPVSLGPKSDEEAAKAKDITQAAERGESVEKSKKPKAAKPRKPGAGTPKVRLPKGTTKKLRKIGESVNENYNYTNNVIDANILNFADTIRERLDMLAHQAIEDQKAMLGASFESQDADQHNQQIDDVELQTEDLIDYINSLDEDQLNEYVDSLDESELDLLEELLSESKKKK